MRALIYGRISKDAVGKGEGVDRQVEDCRALARRLGAEVVGEPYVDNDIGASTKSRKKTRPSYEAMIAAVERGEADVILAYSNSRLTRRPLELERLISLHESTGVVIHTVASGTDDLSTADGRMVARIKASVDAAESERISERTKRAKAARKARGLPQDGRARYGYRRRWEDGKVVGYDPHPVEGPILRGLYLDYAKGVGLAVLCRGLADKGMTSPTGGVWHTSTLGAVLASGFAAGVIREVSTGLESPGVHEPLITTDEWAEFKAEKASREGTWREVPRAKRPWVLAGIARCGLCGKALVLNRSRTGRTPQALCSRYNSSRACTGVWIKTQRVEDVVWDALSNVLPDRWETTAAVGEDSAASAAETARAAEAEVERLGGLLVKLERRRTEDDVPDAVYRQLRREYEAEAEAASRAALEARADARDAAGRAEVDWASLVSLVESSELHDGVQDALRREGLKQVLREVLVLPDGLVVIPQEGPEITYDR